MEVEAQGEGERGESGDGGGGGGWDVWEGILGGGSWRDVWEMRGWNVFDIEGSAGPFEDGKERSEVCFCGVVRGLRS